MRRCGSVIQFVRTRVAKRRCRLKNQELDFVAKPVLNVDIAILLEKIRLEYAYNFGYFAANIPIMWPEMEKPEKINAYFTRDCKFD